jgi:hypothetical protein
MEVQAYVEMSESVKDHKPTPSTIEESIYRYRYPAVHVMSRAIQQKSIA